MGSVYILYYTILMVQKWEGPITKAILSVGVTLWDYPLTMTFGDKLWKKGEMNGKSTDHEMCEWPHLSTFLSVVA